MKIHKLLVVDQHSKEMKALAAKNNVNSGICGYITCDIVQYLSNMSPFNIDSIKNINNETLTPLI